MQKGDAEDWVMQGKVTLRFVKWNSSVNLAEKIVDETSIAKMSLFRVGSCGYLRRFPVSESGMS